jgi:hypothetical protein
LKTILHIGQPKTGTTTLHHAFFYNPKLLGASGILYPRMASDWRQHSVLIPYLTDSPRFPGDVVFKDHWPGAGPMDKSAAFWGRLTDQVARRRPEILLLSGEGYFTVTDAPRLQALSRKLGTVCAQVEVVAYLRSPVGLFASAYQQRLKEGGQNLTRLAAMLYKPALTAYAEFGPGPVTVRKYERAALTGGDIVQDFVAHHLPGIGSLSHGPRNRSLSAEAIAVLAAARQSSPPPQGAAWTDLVQHCQIVDAGLAGHRTPRLTDQAIEYAVRNTRDLPWLADHAGITFADIDYALAGRATADHAAPDSVFDVFRVDGARLEAFRAAIAAGEAPGARLLRRLRRSLRDRLSGPPRLFRRSFPR